LVATPPPPPPSGDEEQAAPTIDAAYKKVRKAAKAVDTAESDEERDEALHRVRKRAKRLRYTASATGDDKVSSRAKTVQSLLGDHQDSVVSRGHLLKEAAAAHAAGEDTFTYGVLYQLEDEVARRAEENLGDALKKLRKSVH
jgi:CHAD domain-containing protein